MKHCIALLFSCLVGSGLVLPLYAQQGKLPAPPPLEQEEKVKLIKQFFKSEYSKKTVAGRVSLGKLLLAKARREESESSWHLLYWEPSNSYCFTCSAAGHWSSIGGIVPIRWATGLGFLQVSAIRICSSFGIPTGFARGPLRPDNIAFLEI